MMWWCPRPDSNRGPEAYKATALPTELRRANHDMVKAGGFEPPTSASQARRSTKLSYAQPVAVLGSRSRRSCGEDGSPGWDRTSIFASKARRPAIKRQGRALLVADNCAGVHAL